MTKWARRNVGPAVDPSLTVYDPVDTAWALGKWPALGSRAVGNKTMNVIERETLGLDSHSSENAQPEDLTQETRAILSSAHSKPDLPLTGAIIVMSRTNDEDSFFAQERDRLVSEITSVRFFFFFLILALTRSLRYSKTRVLRNFSP